MTQNQSQVSKQELRKIIEKVFKATSKDCENIRDSEYLKNKNWQKCLAPEQKFQCYIYDRLCNAFKNDENLLVLVEYRNKKTKNSKEFDIVIFKKNFSNTDKKYLEEKKYLKRTARWPQTYAPKQVQEHFTQKLTPIVALELKMGDQIEKLVHDCKKLKDLKKDLPALRVMYAILMTEGRFRNRKVKKMKTYLSEINKFKEAGGEAWHIIPHKTHEFTKKCAFDSSE